ncbi:DUF3696 domain-containing protein [Chryseobacterium sp. RP-3-3]|uniref:DUF3696 domain-containing protein n=1 Tax=Chryseobacterium antibioticum TaxID=2728847 RepID=A0A7Y0AQ04_9FLAO|nr:DUF3696 domain-containing protein [Chryseobacterium antibioticum]NML71270.1 DUF3696 domain-containing protein [Chryseobacterium antibioticum]
MIKEIFLKNFKCFDEKVSFTANKLNLLTGINGRGKSSLLQSILLISQSNWNIWDKEENQIYLNSSYVELGTYEDIKNSYTTNKVIEIGFTLESDSVEEKVNYLLSENEQDHLQLSARLSLENGNISLADVSSFFKNIHYVSADRIGPRKYVEKLSIPKSIHTGAKGEYSINVLYHTKKQGTTVHEKLYRGENAYTILEQTEEWLSYILDGANLKLIGEEQESSILSLLINNRNDGKIYKSINVGFGYSYILPIIITGLIAKKGEVIIIENPEAHLHPKAQSKIIEFLTKVVDIGVQVFVESHSDHIINGILVQCKKHEDNSEEGISKDNVSIYQFERDENSPSSIAHKIIIEEGGIIRFAPEGFFDQITTDTDFLFDL